MQIHWFQYKIGLVTFFCPLYLTFFCQWRKGNGPFPCFLFLGQKSIFLPTCFPFSWGRIIPRNATSPSPADGLVLGGLSPGSPCAPHRAASSEGKRRGPAPSSSGRVKWELGDHYFDIQLIQERLGGESLGSENGEGSELERFAPIMYRVSAGWVSKAKLLKSSRESPLPT